MCDALKGTLKRLNLSYLDLYLMHGPMAFKEGPHLRPFDGNGVLIFSDVDYIDTWKAMEALVETGLTKSIGVSNFNCDQMDRLIKSAKIRPVTNQVECHPYLNQRDLELHHKKYDIVLTAFGPLGSPKGPGTRALSLLDDTKLAAIAQKYKKSIAQILIRYHYEHGRAVIPKSVTKSRIISNADVFDFKLSEDDMLVIDSLNCNLRFFPFTE